MLYRQEIILFFLHPLEEVAFLILYLIWVGYYKFHGNLKTRNVPISL